MSGFKEKQSEWFLIELGNNIFVCQDEDMENIVATIETSEMTYQQDKYNALLISKSPEMFKMLKKIAKGFDDSKKHIIIKNARKLIKELTEL